MHPFFLRRRPARLVLVLFCISAVTTRAQISAVLPPEPNLPLEQVVVSASRSPQDWRATPSNVSILPLAEFSAEQITSLRDVLASAVGVVVVNTGAKGGLSQIFLRGANAHETLFVVDGVRMNDRSATYNSFLGAADLANLGRIEVLRGPQSTLYGSSAMGGVILLESVLGHGSPEETISLTGGSFDSFGASVTAAGSAGKLDFSGSLERFVTQNDRPGNALHQWSYASKIQSAVTPILILGATFRGENDDYEEPGSTLFPFAGVAEAENYLGTVFVELKPSDDFVSRATLGLHRHGYRFLSDFGTSDLRYTREIVDWQNTWQANQQLEIVGGLDFERSHYIVDGNRTTDRVGAWYLSTTARPIDRVTVTAGLRADDFKSVGSATTWRTGLAWQLAQETKLRATYGTGFSAPGSDDRYGVPEFGQLPNPDLRPEKSRGWDAGIDQDFLNGKVTLGATYFHNRFRNLFSFETVDFVTFQGRTINLAQATTEGAELSLAARPTEKIEMRISYTYLEARDDSTQARLTRRPRHGVDAEFHWQATRAWILGVGIHGVIDRLEGRDPAEDYCTLRLFTGYEFSRRISLKLRVENALNEHYAEVPGYPALPRGVFGTIEAKF